MFPSAEAQQSAFPKMSYYFFTTSVGITDEKGGRLSHEKRILSGVLSACQDETITPVVNSPLSCPSPSSSSG